MSTQSAATTATQDTSAKNVILAPARQLPGLVLFTSLLVLAQHVWAAQVLETKWPLGTTILLALLGVGAFVWLVLGRKGLLANLASSSFAVAILALIALATSLGTFVPQSAPPPDVHPQAGTNQGLTGFLFLRDLFRSWWYGGLLGILAVSLVLAVARRPFWRTYYWGFTLAHGGICLVLLGGLLGRWYGVEGQLPLRVGEVADVFMIMERGHPTQRLGTFGFSIKLESFEVDKHSRLKPPSLTVYRGKEDDRNMVQVCTTTVSEAGIQLPIPKTDLTVSVREYYPDARIEQTLETSDDPRLPAAVQVRVSAGALGETCWLVEGYRPNAHVHSLELDLEWGGLTEGAWALRTKEGRPPRHWVTFPGNTEPKEIKLGETYNLPGEPRPFKVVAFFPSFSYDIENKKAYSTSDEPLNPALQLDFPNGLPVPGQGGPQTHYLFSGAQGHMERGNVLNMVYRYEPGAVQVSQLIRLDVRAARYALAWRGRVVAEGSFKPGTAVEIPGTEERSALNLEVLKSLSHARPERIAQTQSQAPRHPAVRVELRREGHEESLGEALLEGEQNWVQLDEDLVLVLEAYEQEVKTFRSHVTVIREGKVARQATIIVNEPLTVDGYTFYQNDYRPKDPDFSGLRVVKDPGLGLAYAGMILVSLGMTFTLYVRPRLRKANGQKEGAA